MEEDGSVPNGSLGNGQQTANRLQATGIKSADHRACCVGGQKTDWTYIVNNNSWRMGERVQL